MKLMLTAIITGLAASPAFAHANSDFHSHGVETTLVLALIVAGLAVCVARR